MAIAVDDTTVAVPTMTTQATPSTVAGTTASFTAPDNSLLVVCCISDTSSGSTPTMSVTNSGTGLTWSNRVTRGDSEGTGGFAGIARALNATSQSITVTVSLTGTGFIVTGQSRGKFKIYIVTGHHLSAPDGNVGEGSSTTNNITPNAYTSSANNSRGFGCGSDWNALGVCTSTDVEVDLNVGTVESGLALYKAADTATSGTTVTMNFDANGTGAADWNWVAYEVLPAAAAGTTHEKSYSESYGLTNPFARTSVGNRLHTDTMRLQDVFARVGSATRNYTELGGVSETYSRTSIGNRVVTDNSGEADAYRRVAGGIRALTEALGLVDAYQRTSTGNRIFNDTLGESDVYQRVASTVRIFTDLLGLTDVIDLDQVGGVVLELTIEDLLGGTDNVLRIVNGIRAFTELIGLTDVYQRVSSALRSILDASGQSDTFVRTSTGNRSFNDVGGLTDSYSRTSASLRNLVESLGLTDVVDLDLISQGVLTIAVVEVLGVADAYQRTSTGNRVFTDTLGQTDVYARIASTVRIFADSLGLSDAITARWGQGRAYTESVGQSDTYSRQVNSLRAYLDFLGEIEVVSRVVESRRQAEDVLGLVDSYQRISNILRGIVDVLGLLDAFDSYVPPLDLVLGPYYVTKSWWFTAGAVKHDAALTGSSKQGSAAAGSVAAGVTE